MGVREEMILESLEERDRFEENKRKKEWARGESEKKRILAEE